jgi:hypothetical protein
VSGRLRARVALVGTMALAAAALPATANADLIETDACDTAALSQPFAPWGDNAQYKLAPGGDFEGSLDGWKFSGGATRVAGGRNGGYSVRIPAGGSVTTPATCVNAAYPTFRFFSKSSGGLLGLLPAMTVEVLYRDSALRILPLPLGVGLPSRGFQPSLTMLTGSVLAGLLNDGEDFVGIRFRSVLGTWNVDDVYVDPMMRR